MSAAAVAVDAGADDLAAPGTFETSGFLWRLSRRPIALCCLGWLFVVVLVAIVAPLVLPGIASQNAGNLADVQKGPSAAHLLGTDTLGRDVLERLLVGTRVTMIGVAEGVIVGLLIGVSIGLAAGFFGGWIDRVVTWIADLAFSIPSIIVIIVVLSVFSSNLFAGMCTFGVLASPGLMRIVRSATLPVREELYIAAARVSGLSRPYIVTRHVLPRIAGPIIVQASLLSAAALLIQSGLAFLGLLVPAPAPSWGGMIADGMSVLLLDPWLTVPPGIAIAITILAFGLLGDAVRDVSSERWAVTAHTAQRSRPAKGGSDRPAALAGDQRRALPSDEELPLLALERLSVSLRTNNDAVRLIQEVSLELKEGEALGIIGESGCGKTITASAVIGLLPSSAAVESGHIYFSGKDLVGLPERDLRSIRGREIAFISQEPMVALDPAFRVGNQLQEAIRRHRGATRDEARRRMLELLTSVGLPHPESVARRYPHELSGGMAQRVVIARALAGAPKLLIADEPTTALDVTVQAEILSLLKELQRSQKMAILLITHDWGVVADICDRAVVMYAGEVVERAEVTTMFRSPRHPYTEALLGSNPHNLIDAETLPVIPGGVPQPGAWPRGCHFNPRCAYATAACRQTEVELVRLSPERETRCLHHEVLAR